MKLTVTAIVLMLTTYPQLLTVVKCVNIQKQTFPNLKIETIYKMLLYRQKIVNR